MRPASPSSFAATLVALAFALALGAFARPARADVSSWLFAGAGPSILDRPGTASETVPSLLVDTGMGTSARNAVSVGGLLRFQGRFGEGLDYGLLLRVATGGYNRGNWGGAVDLGGYLRPWGDKTPGYQGTVSLGAPWGITLNGVFTESPDQVHTVAVILGLDFARFTVYRSTGTGWWPNPFPTPRSEQASSL